MPVASDSSKDARGSARRCQSRSPSPSQRIDLGRGIEFSTYALHCARSDLGGESIRERLPYMRRKHTTRMHDSYPL
jgi:hypothetical protein